MTMNGYIKLHRKMLEWGWYGDPIVKTVFLHLLLVANIGETESHGIWLKRGQALVGSVTTAAILGISRQQFRTAISKLRSSHEITTKATSKYTLITVVKYEDYQLVEDLSTTSDDTCKPEMQPRLKKNKKYKKYIPPIVPQGDDVFSGYAGEDAELLSMLKDFEAMRKQQKKPMTERAQKKLLTELDKLSGGDRSTKLELLNQSILHCWLSVYPLKETPEPSASQYKFRN